MKKRFLFIKEKAADWMNFGKYLLLTTHNKIKNIKPKKIKKQIISDYKKFSKLISNTWKPLIIGLPSFLFCYYVIGALVSENIDVQKFEREQNEQTLKSQTIETMQNVLRREVDEHIWTPNLPPIFPAYVLDNMPNFQIGAIAAVRDVAEVFKRFAWLNDNQKKPLRKAVKLLNYSPNVWLLAQKSAFSIAPSTNSQYRKARKELEKVNTNGVFYASTEDLRLLLKNMAENLRKLTSQNEAQVREFSSDYIDFNADDLFYYNKGYAFSLWQLSEAIASDFKDTILSADAYGEWTSFCVNLRKAAELKPLIVRNGKPDSLMTPNHLLTQNYYLAIARAQAEKILNMLGEINNAATD